MPKLPLEKSSKQKTVAVKAAWREWLPTLSLGFAAFIFVTSEFMPVGLLPDIAEGLGKTESYTGLLLTGYAWVVALMSLPLTALSARFERRKLMLTLFAIFIIGNFLAGLASSFWLLLSARICIAFAHAVFWAITTPLAARLAPEGKQGKALGVVIAGSSLAVILGVPLGTLLGHALGWRLAFIAISITALIVAIAIARMLPHLPSSNAGSLKSLPGLMRRPELLKVYLLTVLVVTAHFTPFTYINPFLQQIGGIEPGMTVLLLLCLGGSGIPGSWIGGKYADKAPDKAMVVSLAVMCVSLSALYITSSYYPAILVLSVFWGMAMTVAGLVLQTKVLSLASDAADVAVSIYSGIFNIGIGSGALIGSRVIIYLNIGAIGYAGALFAGAAMLFAIPIWMAAVRNYNAKI